MTEAEFTSRFEEVTGIEPLTWQVRLFRDHFAKNELPQVIDLPTGLGKTMVMAIWLITRECNKELPRRLIYVVDRRTVVDQATDLVMLLVNNWREKQCFSGDPPLISTLRGQLADNREWSRDPSRPAIIIGTVDLIGSSLLFSGYRSSYKRRPLEAGLLGQDSLLVLDEVHLSRPFEKLLAAVGGFNRLAEEIGVLVKPTRVIRMSATSQLSDGKQADRQDDKLSSFRLDTDPHSATYDLWSEHDEDGNEKNPVKLRFEAKKSLTIRTLGTKEKFVDKLASAAIELVTLSKPEQEPVVGQRIVVFTRKPDDARAIGKAIRKHTVVDVSKKPKKVKLAPYDKSVEVLTGTMRGLERDEFVKKSVVKRFFDGDEDSSDPTKQQPVFLIATSAGEVGFDLNADHMVCDATTIDSFIQRLGRVNRRGKVDAQVLLLVELPKKDKDGKPMKLNELEHAIANTLNLLTDGMTLSPASVANLARTDWSAIPDGDKNKDTPKSLYELAWSPEPATVELTDIVLDAWSMTSITDRMPGRPEVGPWLRGIDDKHAQTTVAWRAELDLFRKDKAPEKALQAIFARHPIRPHESLKVNTRYLVDAFLKKILRLKTRPADLMTTRIAVRLPRGQVVCKTVEELRDKPGILYADSTLVLPAMFGGLDTESGMLDAESIPKSRNAEDSEPRSLDVADCDGYEQADTARSRLRIVITKSDDGLWTAQPLDGGVPIPDDLRARFASAYEKTTPLFAALKEADLRVRLVQPITFDDEGEAVRKLVILAPAAKNKRSEEQSLSEHVAAVEQHAHRIANELALSNPFREALLFAARWHDEGKKADVWQFFANGPMPDGEHKGKTAQPRSPRTLKGYRHEFGSLLRIHHPDRFDRIDCTLPNDETARDLALHLIATHHGSGRPHFGDALYDPFSDEERDAIRFDSIRRFARLQRKYGWWTLAWFENLLRCADALASADQDAEDDPDDSMDAGSRAT